jgi:RNA polymerase sigma-70 factor, ECF subfamily
VRERDDHQALDEFVADRYAAVLLTVTLACGNRVIAQDAVQEALARAWERRASIDQIDRWILAVAMNLVRSRWRKLRREVPLLSDRPVPDVTEDRGQSLDLRAAIRSLPRRQREVVVLHYFADLPVREIADVLATSEGAVRNALHHGRARLASIVGSEEVRLT